MEGGGEMSVVKYFNEKEARVVETLLHIYYLNRVAVVEEVKGKLLPHSFREYVDEKSESLTCISCGVECKI